MGLASNIIYFAFHPNQLRLLVQWKLWHKPIHERDEKIESITTRVCFRFLDETGRSFSPVIKELHPELLMPVCVFYLVLRGLDTIEDDTSIPLDIKEPLLRNFTDYLGQDGWTFTGNRPEEKDRELLVQFNNVVAEFKNMKPAYQAIIRDITAKMGNGMADYARKAATEDDGVKTVEDYDQYCWYVAGIVGEGLTRLFVEADLADPSLLQQRHLYKSMGLMLQKNNIIRDIREDYDDGRRFWPREIWSKHVNDFEDLFKPENIDIALNCSSEMILNALGHAKDSLTYLAGLREQSVVNFCAIPQSMSLATLELCFRNPAVFKRNMRISKGDAFQLMVESSRNFQTVCEVFHRYIYRIYQKNIPEDPNFFKINAACKEIKRFATSISQNVENVENIVEGKNVVVDKRRVQHQADVQQGLWSNSVLMFTILAAISALILGASWLVGDSVNIALPLVGKS